MWCLELTISLSPSSSDELVSWKMLSTIYSAATARNRRDTSSMAVTVSAQDSFRRSSLSDSGSPNRMLRKRLDQEESSDRWGVAKSSFRGVSHIHETFVQHTKLSVSTAIDLYRV